MSTELLILRNTDDAPDDEIQMIACCARMSSLTPFIITTNCDMTVNARGHCFSLAYLAGHGSIDSFGGNACSVSWDEVALGLCNSACFKDPAAIYCACCYGGERRIAQAFFQHCPNVSYVIGPMVEMDCCSLSVSFHSFLYTYMTKCSLEVAVQAATNVSAVEHSICYSNGTQCKCIPT
jgi:hypothetical protein